METTNRAEYIKRQPEADLIVGNCVDRYKRGLYSLIMVTGLPGTGKSSQCFRLSELTGNLFPNRKVKRIIIENLAQLAKLAMESRENEVNIAVIEEVSTLFPSRRAMAGTSVDLAKVLDTCRKKKLILFANAPLWTSIDGHMRAMGTLYIETLKVYKKMGLVISKFFRLQTNPGSGKTYMHTMLRSGKEVKRMYTIMPNLESWKEYELKKDEFMKNLYIKIQRREEKREDKENKELGLYKIEPRLIEPEELRAYQMHMNGMTYRAIAIALGMSANQISRWCRFVAQQSNSTRKMPRGKQKIDIEEEFCDAVI
jgi:hypothetical protein